MRRSMARAGRLVILTTIIGIGVGHGHIEPGAADARHAAATGGKAPSAALLIYEGKILPVITDVYNSVNDLGTAISDRSVDGIAKIGDQFAAEQGRFENVKPVPTQLHSAAVALDKGLQDLNNGTQALAVGLRASDTAATQRAATQLTQGLKQFLKAVGQVRSFAGPQNSARPAASGTPQPTPVIKGLPG